MAAILRLRRGISTPTLLESELFFNTTSETLVVGQLTGSHTLVKIGENTGGVSFSGDITGSSLLLSGNATIDGNITLGGDIYLGDGSNTTDNIFVNASLSGSLVPDTDGVYDLGADNKRYENIYVMTASIENLIVNGSGILSSSQQITDYNTFLEISGMDIVSGSSQITLNQTTGYISGIKDRLNSETVISGSSQVTIVNTTGYTSFSSSIATTDGVQNDRLDDLELFSSSLDTTYEEIASSTHTLISGSSQVELESVTGFTSYSNSVDNRLIKAESTGSDHELRIDLLESFSSSLDDTFATEDELSSSISSLSSSLTITDVNFEGRINTLETTFSSSVDVRLDNLESFSSSLDDTYVTETELSLATSSLSASLTITDTDFEDRINTLETEFSSSVDLRLDLQESFSSSIDTTIKTKMNLDNVISGSSQILDGSGILSSSNENFTTFSSSVDGRLVEIETTFSSSVDSRLDSLEGDSHTHSNKTQLDTINQNLSKTSNVTFNDITASGNVIVSGDLTVLGTATEIQTSDLYIKDKLITVSSGSTNSAEADGSGIEIDGAGKSLIWDDATQSFILNAKVSSSIGFKGDGSELDNVTAADVEYGNVLNKPTLVSGSTQISFTGITDKPTLFSGSSQVNADTIVNFDSNVKDKINIDDVHSGSYLGVATTSDLDEGINLYWTIDRFTTASYQGGFVSSSSQIYIEQTTNFNTFSQSIDSRLDLQEAFSESLDNEFLNTNGDNVVSGSDQVTASLDLRYEEISSGTNTLVSGSSQIDVTQTTNIETLATTGSNIFVGNQTITGSVFITGSDFTWKTSFTENFPTEVAKDIIAFDDFIGSDGISYTNNHLRLQNIPVIGASTDHTLQLNFGSGYGAEMAIGPRIAEFLVHPSGSDSSGSLSIVDNGDETTTIDLYATNVNLGKSDSTITINGSNIISDSPISSSNHISASFFIGDGSKLENVVASEIVYENITGLPNGLVSGSSQIDITQTNNYSSIKQYDDNDNTSHLNSLGVVSGSTYSSPSQGTVRATINGSNSDVDLGLQSNDTPTFAGIQLNSLPQVAEGSEFTVLLQSSSNEIIVSELASAAFYHVSNSIQDGNPEVLGNAGAVKNYIDSRVLALEQGDISAVLPTPGGGLSGGGDIGNVSMSLDTGSQHFIDGVAGIAPTLPSGLLSSSTETFNEFSSSVASTISGLTTDYTQLTNVPSGIVSGSTQVISLLPTGTVSGSSQITITESQISDLTHYTDSDVKTKLNTENVLSGSSQITITESQISDLTHYTDSDVKTKLDSEGVISGSSQITITESQISDLTHYTDSDVKTKLDTEGVISGSSQILNGTGILSSSVDFETFSGSVDSRIDSLQGTNHTHTNKSNLDTINQNLSTTSNVQFNDIQINGTGSFGSNVRIYGDLTVLGTETIINTQNLAIADNMIYLNSGSTITNPDLGFSGNYNDGTYAHLGLFADASDNNTFKVYKGYTPEPEGDINTAHASFQLADFQSHRNISVTSSTEESQLLDENGNIRHYSFADSNGTFMVSDGGFSFLVDNDASVNAGMTISTAGDTAVYGALQIASIPLNSTGNKAALIGTGNTITYRTLGTNAFYSYGPATDASYGYTYYASNASVSAGTDTAGSITPSNLTSITKLGTITTGNVDAILPNGVVSGSSQITDVTGSFTPTAHIIPDTDVAYDLGSETHRFRDLYLSNNSVKFIEGSVGMSAGDFFFVDYNDEPSPIKTKHILFETTSPTLPKNILNPSPKGGVQFLSISDTQMVTYRIDNYDLQSSVTFDYIDSDGNPQTVSVPANTNYYELDAREGSVERSTGTDKYRIKLLSYGDAPAAPVEVQKLTITGSAGGGSIVSTDSGVKVTDPEDENQPGQVEIATITLTNDSGVAGTKVTANAGNGQVSFTDLFDEPIGIITEQITIPPPSGSSNTTTTVIKQKTDTQGGNGGVSFIEVGSSQCARYRIINHSVQQNLFFNYTDCDGNPVTAAQILTSTSDIVTMQMGSFQRTAGGSDHYDIKLLDYVNADYAVAEIREIQISTTGSSDNIIIRTDDSGGNTPKLTFIVSGSDNSAQLQTGNITVSGSNGTSTITNDLPGEGLAVTDATGSLTPIKAKTFELEDPDTGDVISLSVSNGSLTTSATDATGSSLPEPKANLTGSFTGSLGLTGDITSEIDCVNIGTAINPICNIYTKNLTATTSIHSESEITAEGDIVAFSSSDRRLKENILPISNPLQKINSIGGYSFEWNVEKQHIYSGKDYGVIAQEIEEILPELVDTRENGYKAVKYDKLVSLLIEGIKELSSEVQQLKQQINK